jgi:uncharacterized membrane protein
MNVTTDDPVKKYLKQLDAELADLPRGRRHEIVEEIAEHIAEAQAQHPAQSEADTRTMLERLGDPADIAADARQRFGVVRARPGWMETAALVLLLFGGFVFGVGWIVGLILLWSSTVWKPWEKLLGTLVFPGGLVVVPFILLASGSGDGSGSDVLPLVLVVISVAAPLITTAYLAWRMRRRGELTAA